jgi:hypothetical protein
MDPVQSVEWLENNMIPVFPLGEIKNTLAGVGIKTAAADSSAVTASGAAGKQGAA